MRSALFSRDGNCCAVEGTRLIRTAFPPASDRIIIIMEFQGTKRIEHTGTAPNSSAKMWVESVSAGMRTVEAVLREFSQNDVPVLVVAEHGSGKAAAAARIHTLSGRASEPFQAFQGREASEAHAGGVRRPGWYCLSSGSRRPDGAAQKELVRQIGLRWPWRQQKPCAALYLWNLAGVRARGQGRQVPRRSLLRDQRGLFAAAALAAAPRRHSSSAGLVSLSGGARFWPRRCPCSRVGNAKLLSGISAGRETFAN